MQQSCYKEYQKEVNKKKKNTNSSKKNTGSVKSVKKENRGSEVSVGDIREVSND